MNFETRPHLNTRPLIIVKILGMAKLGIFDDWQIGDSNSRSNSSIVLQLRSERYKAMKIEAWTTVIVQGFSIFLRIVQYNSVK